MLVPGDAPTIQMGIDLAQPGDTVLVAPGTYTESLDFLGKAITVSSVSGPTLTIVDGGRVGHVVSFTSGEGQLSVLEGFTVTGAGTTDGTFGIVCDSSSPTLRDNIVTGNHTVGADCLAVNLGGGIGCIDSAARILDCTVLDNSVTAICIEAVPTGAGITVLGATSDVLVEDCVISGNELLVGIPFGGGIAVTGGSATIRRCLLEGNTGHGMTVGAISPASTVDASVEDCSITDNSCSGITLSQGLIVSGTILARNGGSGLRLGGAGLAELRGVTVTANGGAGVDLGFSGAATLVDTIVWDDTIAVSFGPVPDVSYCDVEGGWPGVGNLDADPLFVDAVAGDYRLAPGSPCIDAGDPLGSPDPDGTPADIGALVYEPWEDVGFGLAGSVRVPTLTGDGPLVGGTLFSLELRRAQPNALAGLFIGFDAQFLPFGGGTLVPAPDLLELIVTSPSGTIGGSAPWPVGVPSATTTWFHFWIVDPAGPFGLTASNAVAGTTR